jgi:hypothetical protein
MLLDSDLSKYRLAETFIGIQKCKTAHKYDSINAAEPLLMHVELFSVERCGSIRTKI